MSLHVGKIILPSGLGSEEFKLWHSSGREGWMGGSPGEGQGNRAAWVFEGWVFILVLSQTLGMAVGKSQIA